MRRKNKLTTEVRYRETDIEKDMERRKKRERDNTYEIIKRIAISQYLIKHEALVGSDSWQLHSPSCQSRRFQ